MGAEKAKDKLILIENLRRYIDTHLMDDITPKGLAKLYGYSYERFRKFFESVSATTIHHYVRLRRLQYAAKLMRQGVNVSEAFRQNKYQTLYGFLRALRDVYGVSPYEYAATRGRVLMTEPEKRAHPDFFVVGYVFEALPDLNWMESGAYWQGQSFPPFDAEEYARIGCGPADAAIWVRHSGKAQYIYGWEASEYGK